MATNNNTGAPLNLPQWDGEVFQFVDVNQAFQAVNDAIGGIIDGNITGLKSDIAALYDAIPSLRQEIWKTAGVYTFKAPKATFYVIECIGGGGGCTILSDSLVGTWGGGGAYARKLATVPAGQIVTVTVGAAGTIGTMGTAGGASSFGSYVTADGGRPNALFTSSNNLPYAGDIALPGIPPFYTDVITGQPVRGFTGYTLYGTPEMFVQGDSTTARISNFGAGAGVGGVSAPSASDVDQKAATPGMVILTYVA